MAGARRQASCAGPLRHRYVGRAAQRCRSSANPPTRRSAASLLPSVCMPVEDDSREPPCAIGGMLNTTLTVLGEHGPSLIVGPVSTPPGSGGTSDSTSCGCSSGRLHLAVTVRKVAELVVSTSTTGDIVVEDVEVTSTARTFDQMTAFCPGCNVVFPAGDQLQSIAAEALAPHLKARL